MVQKIYLGTCVALFFPYGLYCFVNPSLLTDAAGIQAISATGSTELRAMYGGLQAAIGALALSAMFRASLTNSFLVTLVTFTTGLLLARLAGLTIDGGYTSYTGMALGIEATLLSGALYLLKVAISSKPDEV